LTTILICTLIRLLGNITIICTDEIETTNVKDNGRGKICTLNLSSTISSIILQTEFQHRWRRQKEDILFAASLKILSGAQNTTRKAYRSDDALCSLSTANPKAHPGRTTTFSSSSSSFMNDMSSKMLSSNMSISIRIMAYIATPFPTMKRWKGVSQCRTMIIIK
jgi:hypothetical protein